MLSQKKGVVEHMKNYNMNTNELMTRFHYERNHSQNSIKHYQRAIQVFEEYTGKTLSEILEIAEQEEQNNITWKNSTLKPLLINYRRHLYEHYTERTADSYLTKPMTVLRHYEITIPQLPYFSHKHIQKPEPIYADDLPNREILQKAIMINGPLMKGILSLMSSSGISRIDILKLTIKDWLNSTSDYHSMSNKVLDNILEMQNSRIDIIPTFYLTRAKTGQDYFTFSSPESVVYVNSYLWGREEKLTLEDKLFKVHPRYFNLLFQRTNDMLRLGRVNNVSRLSPHMLRRFHATQLMKSGMSTDKINVLQGRKNHDVANQSYIKYTPSHVKKEYMECLPYIVIEPYERLRTELDLVKEENKFFKEKEEKINEMLERLERLENS